MTSGRRTKCVLFLDNGTLGLLAISAASYKNRVRSAGG
jgi:hypothetical protein